MGIMISRTTLLVAAGAAAVLIGAGVTASDSFRGSILGLVRGELDPHEDPLHSLPGHKGVYVVDEGMEGRNSVWADPLDEVD